ncbi:hypothetical protein Tco_1097070 [Tanacetum coccineum]
MKSAMMKALYFEIKRLKQVGQRCMLQERIMESTYQKDRYVQEEKEKKAMAEKIEGMKLDAESRGNVESRF